MELTHIHTNKFVAIHYDAHTNVIWYKFTGLFETALGLEGHRAVMAFTKNTPAISVVFDATDMKGTFTSLAGFMKNEYTPTMEKQGLKYVSFILNNKDVFLKFAFNQIVKFLQTTIQIKAFNSLDEGKSWLEEKMGIRIAA